jgi:hypothetical protein
MAMPTAAVGKLFVAAEGAGAGGSGAAFGLRTTFLVATIFNSMMFFSQNKPPLVFSEGVILDLSGYYGVFFALGFAGALAAGALAAAGFLAKVCFFFAGAAGTGVGSGTNFTRGGSGTYRSVVISAGGSNLYGADTLGVVTASRG